MEDATLYEIFSWLWNFRHIYCSWYEAASDGIIKMHSVYSIIQLV